MGNQKIDELAQEILSLEMQLNSNILSTLWISDLHGEGDRFFSILKNRFGMLYQTCLEVLPKDFSREKILSIGQIIQTEKFLASEQKDLSSIEVIQSLIAIIRYKLQNHVYTVEDIISSEYRAVIRQMIEQNTIPSLILDHPLITQRIVKYLCQTVKKILLDHIIILGDIFDRGSQPDKIIRLLASKPYSQILQLVFGNHDILWMGACVGNQSLIAEALRITCRYDHMDLIKRLGIDITVLQEFAQKYYPPELVTGNFKAKTPLARSMEKALAIIQFKLEEKTIKQHPEFEMDARMWLDRLVMILRNQEADKLLDTHFPTLNFDHPDQLNADEQKVIDELTQQFLNSSKIKLMMRFFFEKGRVYHIYNNFLNIHALIPSTKDGIYATFAGYQGKTLLDFLQTRIDSIGKAYFKNQPQKEPDLALMFYLWCGPKSPFFGKNAMKTFERYFMKDKATHKEENLYWDTNLKEISFQQLIKNDFNVQRVVYGHTPQDYSKGAKISSADGFAINIDGGFAAAYFNRGHALVQIPHKIYGIILPKGNHGHDWQELSQSVPAAIETIAVFKEPLKIKDTYQGNLLLEKRNQLLKEFAEYEKSI